MRKLIFFILIMTLFAIVYIDISTPDFIKINRLEVEQCSRAMEQDPYFICD